MSDMVDPGYRTTAARSAGDLGAVIRYGDDGLELVNLPWGLRPSEAGGRPRLLLRSEGRRFAKFRCLIPASEFYLSRAGKRYRLTTADGDWFYFAGIWRPASDGWTAAYASLTIAANADVEPYHHRQVAVIRRGDRLSWLDMTATERELLHPLPAGSFNAEEINRPVMSSHRSPCNPGGSLASGVGRRAVSD